MAISDFKELTCDLYGCATTSVRLTDATLPDTWHVVDGRHVCPTHLDSTLGYVLSKLVA